MTKEEIIKEGTKVFSRPTLLTDNITHYCPGCGHGVAHKLIAEAIEELGIQSHPNLKLVEYDLTDLGSNIRLLQSAQPDEVYNLAAMSFVPTSWSQPVLTAEFDAVGVIRILEAIRLTNPEARFYQASSSEMFVKVREVPQNELTPFYPRSPYAVAKLYAYWITVNYREAYGMYACNGILFNHESPRRGETFVTRKITRGLANIAQGLEDCLYMGNMDALRDWGHAKDYVRMQWLMLQPVELAGHAAGYFQSLADAQEELDAKGRDEGQPDAASD